MSDFLCRQGQWPAPSLAQWWQPWTAAAAGELPEAARLGAGELEHLTGDPIPTPCPGPARMPRNDRRSILGAVSRWWRHRARSGAELFEPDATGSHEQQQIAKDPGLSVSELRSLI